MEKRRKKARDRKNDRMRRWKKSGVARFRSRRKRSGAVATLLSLCFVSVLLSGAQGHSLRGMVAHPKCVHLGWAPDLVRGLGPEAAKSTVSFWRKGRCELFDTLAEKKAFWTRQCVQNASLSHHWAIICLNFGPLPHRRPLLPTQDQKLKVGPGDRGSSFEVL